MENGEQVREFPFLSAGDENFYRQFPEDLEDSEQVFFHRTAEQTLSSILNRGFIISGSLASVSFAKNSALALKYACEARNRISPMGCDLRPVWSRI